MFKNDIQKRIILIVLGIIPLFIGTVLCDAHTEKTHPEDFKGLSVKVVRHLETHELDGYLHGHEYDDGSTGYFDFDPDIDDSRLEQMTNNLKAANEWAAGSPWDNDPRIKKFGKFSTTWVNGCAFDNDNDGIFEVVNNDCYHAFIRTQGLAPLSKNNPTPYIKPSTDNQPDNEEPTADTPTEEEQPIIPDSSDQPKEEERRPLIEDTPTGDNNVDAPIQPKYSLRSNDYTIDYEPCVLTSKVVEGIQVVEYMINYHYTNYDEDGHLWYEGVYPQWFEVLNTTDDTINLKGAVLKYAQDYEHDLTGEAEIETDFEIEANSVGLIATLPPTYYRIWYNDDGSIDDLRKRVFRPRINDAPYYYFNDTHDHDMDLKNRWVFEFNGKEVFESSNITGQTYYMGEPCQYPSAYYGRQVLYYSRVIASRATAHANPTPGYYEKPTPNAPSARRITTTTWAALKAQ